MDQSIERRSVHMTNTLLMRWWYGLALLAVGAWVACNWAMPESADRQPFHLAYHIAHTAADQVLLGHRVNLNCATADDLKILSGIGPALAARIIDDRQQHGAFSSVAALDRVRGIGPATLSHLAPFVRVGGCPDNS